VPHSLLRTGGSAFARTLYPRLRARCENEDGPGQAARTPRGPGRCLNAGMEQAQATRSGSRELSLICVDGAVVPAEQAQISVTDEGLLRGDGVFEVTRLYDGRPFALEDHLDRMERSAANLRLPLDREAVERDVQSLLEETQPGDALVRVFVTRGGRRVALLEALPPIPPSLALASVTYAPTLILDGIKSLSYAANMLATRLAQERGFDDALLITPEGGVLECPTSSFFWVQRGELLTTPLADHVLDSITRRLIVSALGAREQRVSLQELAGADEAFIASSVREVVAVRKVEQHEFAAPGPITGTAAEAVRAEIGAALAGAGG
jgi:branched-chain amino acid aminotransferase